MGIWKHYNMMFVIAEMFIILIVSSNILDNREAIINTFRQALSVTAYSGIKIVLVTF